MFAKLDHECTGEFKRVLQVGDKIRYLSCFSKPDDDDAFCRGIILAIATAGMGKRVYVRRESFTGHRVLNTYVESDTNIMKFSRDGKHLASGIVKQFEFVLGGREPAKINHAANLHQALLRSAQRHTPSMAGHLMNPSCFTGQNGKRKHAADAHALKNTCFDDSDGSDEEKAESATRQPQNLEGNDLQRTTKTRTNNDAACPNAPAFEDHQDE